MRLSYAFLEYGKKFIQGGGATDFVELSYTSNFSGDPVSIARDLRRALSAPELTFFRFRPETDAAAVFVESPYSGFAMFCLVQARRENELNPASNMTRPFYQIHFQVISTNELYTVFKQDGAPFGNLFFAGIDEQQLEKKGKYRLKDYWEIDTAHPESITMSVNEANAQTSLIYGERDKVIISDEIREIVNYLAVYFQDKLSGKSVPSCQVRVIGEISLEKKFGIVDAVNRLLRPLLRQYKISNNPNSKMAYSFVTFAFDYVTTLPVHILFLRNNQENQMYPQSAANTKIVEWKA